MQPFFNLGQLVCLRADPSRSGSVIEILPPAGGRSRYRIFHSPTQILEYHEEQLVDAGATSKTTGLLETLKAGQWLDVQSFRARLTAARLSHPQIDNLYALHSARIKFIPFQFKPLLRFLRADQPRLLIADEVGVGKTIEAGLILRELQTRQQLDNILIVCPKALVSKWRAEMRRFDEDFRPLTSETLSYCLREADLDGVWPPHYSRAIVHLELLRIDKYHKGIKGHRSSPGLTTLNPSPRFSLVIVDEAHHLRNPGTSSHEVVKFLCDISEAVIFLSATPLHLGNRNLYTLLNLLRPDLFLDETVFNEMVQPNQHLNQAIRHIRSRLPQSTWQTSSLQALRDAATTTWGKQVLSQDPRFMDWYQKFLNRATLTDADRINCLRDLEEVHSLAHVMNRTRRRDIGRFTIREPHTISVPFTLEQEEFYQALIEFRREMLSLDYEEQVIRLITDTLERQAASCLPALVPTLNKFIQTGKIKLSDISDDIETENEDTKLLPYLLEKAKHLRKLAAALPPNDPKLDQLLRIIEETLLGECSGKVLVFSFFLHTLAYLQKQLQGAGYRVEVITGEVEDAIREHLRERFRLPRKHPDALDILLSSEVGCEGLDYEFCDRLVNYDIPWNPMRIEQRIGRIDRFGQQSDKVLIFNFVTPGTVEERIFFRCFERLGIFQDTIGDLEEVLGDVVQDLTRVALDPKLSPEQAEQKAQQMADNALRLAEEQHRLEVEGGSFLGLDEGFTSDINSVVDQDKFVSANDLRQLIEMFVEQPTLEGQITVDSRHSGLHRLRLNKDGRGELLKKVRSLKQSDRSTVTFTRWLEGSELHWLLTFDQKIALEQRDIPFITPIHPLARVAIAHLASIDEPLVTQVAIHDNTMPLGQYLFVCDLWETVAVRPEVRLVGKAWNLDNSCLAPEVSEALVRLLSHAVQPAEYVSLLPSLIDSSIQQLDETVHQHRLKELNELRERNNTLLNRKLASLDAYYQNRLQRLETELNQAKDERIIRMKESERSRIQRDYESKRSDLENRSEADIISQRVAVGILIIKDK
ncbi:MAG: SNF2-related protein [Nostoc sp.]|uniref:DEAD/DEAH box helicase n=1 Tax=Nostoc sp. TaxID=1180 RepID=UPI002FF5A53E